MMSIGRAPQQGQGYALQDSVWLNGLAGSNNQYVQSVTAKAGGGAATATPIGTLNAQGIEAALVEVRTVVTAGDSCQLPQAIAGKSLDVFNSTANSTDIFANPNINKATGITDTINALATATAYAIAAGVSARFFCPRDGIWAANKSA